MEKTTEKRLYRTLRGHYHELMAVFERTSAHKLPGAKGILREDAVAQFISGWIPRRFTAPTNVFATNDDGKELNTELDLVVHDSFEGAVWNLDAQAGNCVATWKHIRLVMQVKSTLKEKEFNEACEAMKKVVAFAQESGEEKPPQYVLFSYVVDKDFYQTLLSKFAYSHGGAFPFDAIILLDQGAFFSSSLDDLRVGIETGLSPEMVANDGPSQSKLAQEFCEETRIPEGYRLVGQNSSEDALLALASVAAYASAGDKAVQTLLGAIKRIEFSPIFEEDSDELMGLLDE